VKYQIIIIGLVLTIASCHLDLLSIVNDEDLITHINKQGSTWKAGPSERFADISIGTFRTLLGALKTPEDKKLKIKTVPVPKDLPANFDSRVQWPTCDSLKEVRDQSTCGSCWAFGAVEAMSDRICITSGGKKQTRISSENLVSCCSSCGDGCNGGYPASAWQYFQDTGLPTGGLFGDNATCQPYSMAPCDHHVTGKYGPCSSEEFPTPECSSECVTGYPKSFSEDLHFALDVYQVSGVDQIRAEIFANGSVEADFEVYADFPTYQSGVYQHLSGSYLGGHAIKVIGWGVENGTDYWLCVNSWNEGWGDAGTFKILSGENHCGIEGDIVAGTIKTDEKFLKYLENY